MQNFDFIRFTFDGKSSDEFGLYVVSGGEMYNESITPEFENRTARIPGRLTSLYWGTDLTDKTFDIRLATDSMTDLQLNSFKKHFQPGKVGALSFEESAFQSRQVLLASQPIFNFIPFKEETAQGRQNIYKGDLILSFVSLSPYAESELSLANSEIMGKSWFIRSGIPQLTAFPQSDDVNYFLANDVIVKNRVVQSNSIITPNNKVSVFHAGNAPAPCELKFIYGISLGPQPDYQVDWSNLSFGGKGRLTKPIQFIDIEKTIALIVANFENWAQTKGNVLKILREELSSELRDSLIALTNATGAGLTFPTVASLIDRIQQAFFYIDGKHLFSLNGYTQQASLTFVNGLTSPATSTTARGDIVTNITGSYNGHYLTVEPNGVSVPLTTQVISFNRSFADVKISFKNTYV